MILETIQIHTYSMQETYLWGKYVVQIDVLDKKKNTEFLWGEQENSRE